MEAGEAYEGDLSYTNLIAWSWRHKEQVRIVITNYSPNCSRGWIRPPFHIEGNSTLELKDELTGATYERDLAELREKGLYIDLEPYHSHIFSAKSVD